MRGRGSAEAGQGRQLVELAESPSATEARPCPRCAEPCGCPRRSSTCTCTCSPDCARCATSVASDELVVVTPAVRPLAFEVASLRHLPVVDARDAPEPELCFRSRSLVHVDVVALAIAERAQALGLESTWAVVVRPPAEPGASTLAIAPVSAAPLPPDRLREEARALAVGFADTVRARARRALDDRSALVVDPGTNAALVGGPTEPRVRGLAELTRREREVLGHFLQGYALDTIACELGISAQTVRNHLKSVAAKLGARSQKELRELFAARVVLWRG